MKFFVDVPLKGLAIRMTCKIARKSKNGPLVETTMLFLGKQSPNPGGGAIAVQTSRSLGSCDGQRQMAHLPK